MANQVNLNQHLLRTMLLEGENGEYVLNAVRAYNKGEKTGEARHTLVDTIKKEITKTTRELLADSQVDFFIDEVTSQTS